MKLSFVGRVFASFALAVGFSNTALALAPEVPISTKLQVNLQHTFQMHWNKVSKHVHSLKCYPSGKGDGHDDLGDETLQRTSFAEGVGSFSTPISSTANFALGSINGSIADVGAGQDGQHTVAVSLSDDVNWSAYLHRDDSDCVKREHHWKISSHHVQGQFVATFTMPANTWLVELRIEDVKGAGAQFPKKMKGDLHEAVINRKQTFVWAAPGTEVSVPIEINMQSPQGTLLSFNLKIDTLRGASNESLMDGWKKIRKQMTNAATTAEADQTGLAFLRIGSEVLRSPTAANDLAGAMGIEEYKNFLDWLFVVANDSNLPSRRYEMHMKAMAAAVGYELALALLTDMKSFCTSIDVYLPLSDRTVKTNGFIAAHYWMNRDVRRLEGIQFPELRAYLDELVRWENNGFKYSDVANRDADYLKLRNGFIKLRQHSEIAFDVYGDMKRGLKKTVAVFGTFGANELLNASVMSELDGLSAMRSDFNRDLQAEIAKFNRKNEDRIQSSLLLKKLTDLEARSKGLGDQLLSRLKLVSLSPDDAGSSVVGVMTSLLAHQVAIFEEPLRSPFAEPVRKAFANLNRAKSLQQSYQQCLSGGN